MSQLNRRNILLGAGASLLAQRVGSLSAAGANWVPTTPAEAGFAPDLEARLDALISGKRVWNLHGVVIARGGRLVLERYYEGADSIVGKGPIGQVAFNAETLHDLRSVTKSVVGLLYGIALAQGRVPAPETPLFAAFPDYAELARVAGRDRLTIHHVLSMTMGQDWNEEIPYSDPANSELMMEAAPDRYRFVLDRPFVAEPGKRWIYSGGATALVGRIVAKGTRQPLPDFARAALFDPLGIGPTEWFIGDDGEAGAASGLRMRPRDLTRIGQLMLNDGLWEGRRVVPASWVERCTTPVVSVDEFRRYGYHWYIGDFAFGTSLPRRLERWVGAFGLGGQRLFVMPGLELVVAITAGNYYTDDQWVPPIRVIREVVLPSIR